MNQNSNPWGEDDFDDMPIETQKQIAKQAIEIQSSRNNNPYQDKKNYQTDTSHYNPLDSRNRECVLITPEKAKEDDPNERFADPVIAIAVESIEHKIGRKINYDEFDKLCKTYAADLTEADRRSKGEDRPNPQNYMAYYNQLIQNKKVIPAHQIQANQHEQSLVNEIDGLMKQSKMYQNYDMHIEAGRPINIRHQGKVIIKDEGNNREITINNKDDVKLLHMRHRQEFLDKLYKEDIARESGQSVNHDNDGFE